MKGNSGKNGGIMLNDAAGIALPGWLVLPPVAAADVVVVEDELVIVAPLVVDVLDEVVGPCC